MKEQQARLTTQQVELVEYRDHLKELVLTRTADLQNAKEAAEVANNAKSAFLTHMSHTLQAPLHAILRHSKQISDVVNEKANGVRSHVTAAVSADIAHINQASQHLFSAIDQIIQLSQLEAESVTLSREIEEDKHTQTKEKVKLADLFFDLDDMFRPLAEKKGLTFTSRNRLSPDKIIESDEDKLTRLLSALLDNSIKFTTEGTVTLRMQTISAFEQGQKQNYIWFSITDTGIGMSEETQSHIFEPFWQRHTEQTDQFAGFGLGLTLSQRLCQSLGGKLTCESVAGEGSTFHIYLPDKTDG